MKASSKDVMSERSSSSLRRIKKLLLNHLKIGEAKLPNVRLFPQGNN